ncbi:MAG: phosphoenolpyruvate---glycerone phosphotransferase subunit DhaL [Clostridiales bacterium]|nr:phosphoenolpyruvate---glycerone phosphotransferase subunit DhaL [Clostridiales bacterium]MDK2934224.1 phosphoenolpyruvate---glycerone phosphotransferase subunit DhaL [Clostridiales bacterium]
MNTLRAKEIKQIFNALADLMSEKKEWLIELDGIMGDGDLGLTMSTGFIKASEGLKDFEEQDVGKLFAKAGMIFAQSVPSTMGTLMATGLMKGGKAIQGKQEVYLSDMAQMLNEFVEGIMARGKAKPGDKTIIDSLYPAVQALKSAAEEQKSLKEGLTLAYQAAVQGVEETKNMISKHGRAAYYQEKSLGKQDPGATVGMLFIKAFTDYVAV